MVKALAKENITPVREAKDRLRQTYRAILRAQSNPDGSALDQAEKSEAIGRQLEKLFKQLRAAKQLPSGPWAAFQPNQHEPEILPTLLLLDMLHPSLKIDWAYPRVEGQQLGFYVPQDPAIFEENQWGILEPDPAMSLKIERAQLRGLLIPGVAFDVNCNRLGRGGGFYDRVLSGADHSVESREKGSVKIGIAFDWQISETELPAEAGDVPMDWVVTETRCLMRSNGDGQREKT